MKFKLNSNPHLANTSISNMNKPLEASWLIYLLAIWVASSGLLTGFRIPESLDIQLHDTYYVIQNTHLLLFLLLISIISYLLCFGLKLMAHVNRLWKWMSTLIAGMITLLLISIVIALSIILLTTSVSGNYMMIFGVLTFNLGLGIYFILNLKGIWRVKIAK
jgi:uncharacterized membrane protein